MDDWWMRKHAGFYCKFCKYRVKSKHPWQKHNAQFEILEAQKAHKRRWKYVLKELVEYYSFYYT
jgi:hypothetical protein